MSKTGVIIANTGSPSAPTPDAVREYLKEFLTDPRIRPMNPLVWGIILNAFILPKRSVASAEKYKAIWTDDGSPLVANAESLAKKASDSLGDGFAVRAAMSYGKPSMRDALQNLRDEGCERIVAISLYPQSAYSTAGVVKDKLDASLQDIGWRPEVEFVESYGDEGIYLDAVADSIRDAGFGEEGDKLLMAFHSIPMADIEQGDTYAEQARSSAEAITERLGIEDSDWCIGFQSRFDKNRKWLGPFTAESLEALGECKRLFVVTPNFSIDCLETLHDIGIVLRGRYSEDHPSSGFTYVECLNDSDAHVRLIEHLVRS